VLRYSRSPGAQLKAIRKAAGAPGLYLQHQSMEREPFRRRNEGLFAASTKRERRSRLE